MAIKPTNVGANVNTGSQIIRYEPGTTSFPAIGACGVVPGDLLIVKAVTGPGLQYLVPDADGYLPHLAYYPGSDFLSDPTSPMQNGGHPVLYGQSQLEVFQRGGPTRKTHAGFCYTNDAIAPCIRVNMTRPLFCRYTGAIQIEGGDTTGAPTFDDSLIYISYVWARAWVNRIDDIMVMVNWLAPVEHRMSMFNTTRGTNLQIPFQASSVKNPDGNALIANMGTGSATSSTLDMSGRNFVEVGPYPFVATTADAGALEFQVWI